MNIGFDLDGIFIDKPPLIPRRVIEWIYRGPQNHEPKYRLPINKFEQQIRKFSHYTAFRPKISKNIEFLKYFSSKGNHQLFLISSRFAFLENETMAILKKYGLRDYFEKIYLNTKNEQPHIFKKKVLEKLNIDIFVEDDLMLLNYLHDFFPKIKLLWYNRSTVGRTSSGILHIKDLKEIYPYLK